MRSAAKRRYAVFYIYLTCSKNWLTFASTVPPLQQSPKDGTPLTNAPGVGGADIFVAAESVTVLYSPEDKLRQRGLSSSSIESGTYKHGTEMEQTNGAEIAPTHAGTTAARAVARKQDGKIKSQTTEPQAPSPDVDRLKRNIEIARVAAREGRYSDVKTAFDRAEEALAIVASLPSADETGNNEETRNPVFPFKVIAPCGIMAVLSWVWWLSEVWCNVGNSYHSLSDASSPKNLLLLGTSLYWVAMPVVNVFMGFYSTCESGPPSVAYKVYAGFLLAHLVIAGAIGSYIGFPDLAAGSLMQSFPIVALLMALEHFDMSTDSLFAGSTAACSEDISSKWAQSWYDIPIVGGLIGPVIEEMGFSGLALTLFITCAYLPQFLNIISVLVPLYVPYAMSLVLLWVKFGWLCGLPVVLGTFALIMCTDVKRMMKSNWDHNNASPQSFAVWTGLLLFEPLILPSREQDKRTLFVSINRLLWENLVQIWLQSSYFAAAFHLMSNTARIKALLSIAVAWFLSILKLVQFIGAFHRWNEGTGIWYYVAFLIMFLPFLFACWVPAKVYFAFKCEHHIWNLTSGCV